MKTYENDQIKVTWEPSVCMHATKCWKQLYTVFRPMERPWVNLEGASAERIATQIDRCPSGALKYELKGELAGSSSVEGEVMQIQMAKDGPMLMQGNIKLVHSDGSEETRSGNLALCRCGASANKPFCDGSHKKAGFEG